MTNEAISADGAPVKTDAAAKTDLPAKIGLAQALRADGLARALFGAIAATCVAVGVLVGSALDGAASGKASQPLAWRTTMLAKNGPAFVDRLIEVARAVDAEPSDLASVIAFETAGTFSPSVRNPNSTATGLIQFLASTAEDLGTSTDALAEMSAVKQLDYVEKYLKRELRRSDKPNLGDLYMAVFWPAAVGRPDSWVLFRRGSRYYAANTSLDVDSDGRITRGEAASKVRDRLNRGLRLEAATR